MGRAGLCPLPIRFGLKAMEAVGVPSLWRHLYSFRRLGDGHDDGPGTVTPEFADRKTEREPAEVRTGKLGSTK